MQNKSQKKLKKIIIIGATSSIAEHCARLWIQQAPVEIILVGRDYNKTEQIACDLRVRGPNTTVTSIEADFHDPEKIKALADQLNQTSPIHPIDIILIAHGVLSDQQQCQKELTQCHDALAINGLSPILFAEAFSKHMEKTNHGTLAIIGSVAGDRGRKSNYIYGAAKALVASYTAGLQHRFANTNVRVTLIKPGPTDTPMTAHLKRQGQQLTPVTLVAKSIVKGISQGQRVIYTPIKWLLIMMIIRHIPHAIFKKMDI
ncbi:MAG: SDR family NAD(P)-dependent oxidoreductase [Legionella sp.]|nr:SDR family NAD(P)-dependent oxidoreductase [Legionella sp.]